MKYCPNCGAQLPDNANFCPACGTRSGASQQPQYQQPQYQQGYQPSQGKNGGMCLNDVALYSLSSAAKWIKTIGVIATIMMIMFAVFGIIMAIAIPKGYGALVLIPILIIIGIYLYPIIKSYSVGRNIKQAVMQNDENYLQEGLANMKSMFTYIGVLSIIGLVFFCIYMIIAIFGIINVANQASYHYY